MGKRYQNTPIVVLFRDCEDIEYIMANVQKVRATNFSVDHDRPRESQEARGRL